MNWGAVWSSRSPLLLCSIRALRGGRGKGERREGRERGGRGKGGEGEGRGRKGREVRGEGEGEFVLCSAAGEGKVLP